MSLLDPVDTSGAVSIERVSLTSYRGQTVDVIGLFQKLHIYEDIFANNISGTLTILDATNFVSLFPVIGQETLTIEYTAVGAQSKYLELAVYKVSKVPTSQNASIVELHFVSKEAYANFSTIVSKAFKGTHAEIAKAVFEEYLPFNRPLEIEQSKHQTHVVSPKWNPIYLLNWLAARSIPATGTTPSYFFYETIEGFKFVSLESKFRKNSPIGIWRRQVPNASQSANSQEKDKVAYNTATIQDYRVIESFDFLSSQSKGMLTSEMYIVDSISNGYKKVTFNYLDEFKNSSHLNESPLSVGTSSFGLSYNNPGQVRVVYDNSKAFSSCLNTNRYEDWTQSRMSFIQQLNGLRLWLKVAGQGVVKVGDVVSLEFPLNSIENMLDPVLSGNYVVTAIHHEISLTDHDMTVEVCKDSIKSIPMYI